jgi:ElaB/YqjD/DUF883 family membrane-anchored ribosome-binding protein
MKKKTVRSSVSKTIKKDIDKAKAVAEKEWKVAQKKAAKVEKAIGEASKKAKAYIKKNPKKVAAVSAGAIAALGGLAVGAFFGRKKKKKK